MDLSFSGAGFMGCYYFGVVDCWKKYVPAERVNRVAGASAGSLIAAYYLMDLPLSTCLRKIIELTEDVRRRPLGVFDRSNQIVDVLPRVLDELFPEDAHKRVGNRLHVCMTRLKDMKKVIVNEFHSKKDLIEALNCSCFIPVWSGNHVSTFRGVKHIDGGFSDNLPVFDEHTIRVCCFSGATDISPYDRAKLEMLSGKVLNMPLYFTLSNCRRARKALFPPPASFILALLERGFHDAKDFILTNDLIQCEPCWRRTDPRDQPVFARASPTITPAASPAISPAHSHLDLSSAGRAPAKSRWLSPAGNQRSSSRSRARSSSPERSSFRSLLASKLERVDAAEFPRVTIRVSDADAGGDSAGASPTASSSSSSEASGESAGQRAGLGARLAARRNTTQLSAGQLIADKFTLAPIPLPSCPPSPNLNRHCTECIRMRQEARNDLVAEDIRREADKYRAQEPASAGLRSKLGSPFRWIRQLGVKNSYKFEREPAGKRQPQVAL